MIGPSAGYQPMPGMPHSRNWMKQLSGTLGKPAATKIISIARLEYQQLMAAEPPIFAKTRSLTNNLKTQIYPGLAIYRALSDIYPDSTSRLDRVEELFKTDFFNGMIKGIRLINNLKNPFPLIRPVLRLMTQDQYLPGYQKLVEDSSNCFAIDKQRCFILDVLTALNASELTILYCKTDDWLSEALPKVHWVRTKTLAQGDDKCDFRWCRYH